MRAPARRRMIVPGPACRRIHLEANLAAQPLALGDTGRFCCFYHLHSLQLSKLHAARISGASSARCFEELGTDLEVTENLYQPSNFFSIWTIRREFVLFVSHSSGNVLPRSRESTSSMQKSSARSLPSLSVRIDLDKEGRIGPGKIELLENIRTCGSISAAGRAMDMSYKRAWDLVDEINRICRQAAVSRQTGGKNGGGAMLTPFGQSLVARYRKIERDAASAAKKELAALRSDIGRPTKAAGR
jgi:molybdate transport system regulatory protein